MQISGAKYRGNYEEDLGLASGALSVPDCSRFDSLSSRTVVHVCSAEISSDFGSAQPAQRTFRFGSTRYTYPTCLFAIPKGSRKYLDAWKVSVLEQRWHGVGNALHILARYHVCGP